MEWTAASSPKTTSRLIEDSEEPRGVMGPAPAEETMDPHYEIHLMNLWIIFCMLRVHEAIVICI